MDFKSAARNAAQTFQGKIDLQSKFTKLTPEAERFYAEAVRSLKPNVSGAAAGAAIGSQRERVEQY